MESTPLVSVILPFYNAENTLNKAIASIAQQSYPHFECILTDNNSTDGSREIAQRWVNKDQRFLLISEQRQGVMYASNTASQQARGKYTARMDADDIATPKRLECQVQFLEQQKEYDAVAGQVAYLAHKSDTKGFSRYVNWSNSILSYEDIYLKQFVESPIVNPTAMWRSKTGITHGLYRKGDFPEDYEMWLRWLSKGIKIHKLAETLLHWQDSDNRLTRTHPIYSQAAFYRIKSQYLALWLKKNNPFHPYVSIWGASRISRKRAQLLQDHDITIKHWIDIKKSRQLNEEILYYQELPDQGKHFILVYVPIESAREKIQLFLHTKGYREGKDYLLVS